MGSVPAICFFLKLLVKILALFDPSIRWLNKVTFIQMNWWFIITLFTPCNQGFGRPQNDTKDVQPANFMGGRFFKRNPVHHGLKDFRFLVWWEITSMALPLTSAKSGEVWKKHSNNWNANICERRNAWRNIPETCHLLSHSSGQIATFWGDNWYPWDLCTRGCPWKIGSN